KVGVAGVRQRGDSAKRFGGCRMGAVDLAEAQAKLTPADKSWEGGSGGSQQREGFYCGARGRQAAGRYLQTPGRRDSAGPDIGVAGCAWAAGSRSVHRTW